MVQKTSKDFLTDDSRILNYSYQLDTEGNDVEFKIEDAEDITDQIRREHERLTSLHSRGNIYTGASLTQPLHSVTTELIEEWNSGLWLVLNIKPGGLEKLPYDPDNPSAPQNKFLAQLNRFVISGSRRTYQSYGAFLEEQETIYNPAAAGHGFPNYDGVDVSEANTEIGLWLMMTSSYENGLGTPGRVTEGVPVMGTFSIKVIRCTYPGEQRFLESGFPPFVMPMRSALYYTTTNRALSQSTGVPKTPDVGAGHMQVTKRKEMGTYQVQIDATVPDGTRTWSDIGGRGMLNSFAEALTPQGLFNDYYIYQGNDYNGHPVVSLGDSNWMIWYKERGGDAGGYLVWLSPSTGNQWIHGQPCTLNYFDRGYPVTYPGQSWSYPVPDATLSHRASFRAPNWMDYNDWDVCNPTGPNSSRTSCERNICEFPASYGGNTIQGGLTTEYHEIPFLTGQSFKQVRETAQNRRDLVDWCLNGVINRTNLFDPSLRGMSVMDNEGINSMVRVDKYRVVYATINTAGMPNGSWDIQYQHLYNDPYWSMKRWHWVKDW